MKDFFAADRKGNTIVVRFSFDEINLEEREDLKKKLHSQLDGGVKNYVVDLSGVGFVSSLVIATILFFAKEVKAMGGETKISGLSNEAYGIFQLTKLDRVFELYDTEKQALNSF